MEGCQLCPRQCGAQRSAKTGRCGVPELPQVARAARHLWEEPCISGAGGSGAIFFTGCPLGCVYCQNHAISRGRGGQTVTPRQLADMMLALEAQGVHNINLVTPMHFTPQVVSALERVKHRLGIPVIVNTGGYERPQTLAMWDGLADIWLPDLKYHAPDLAGRYSEAPDYFEVATAALMAMHRQQPTLVWDRDGLMQSGLLVRHLVLPGAYRDSLALIAWLADALPVEAFRLSLMRQFTPTPACASYSEINRKVTTFEYNVVLKEVQNRGIQGFSQGPASADGGYVPAFDLTGLPGHLLGDCDE